MQATTARLPQPINVGAPRRGAHSDIGAYERPNWLAERSGRRPQWHNPPAVEPGGRPAQPVERECQRHSDAILRLRPFCGLDQRCCECGSRQQHPSAVAQQEWQNRRVERRHQSRQRHVLSSTHYGSFPGWTAATLSTGADNNTRLLWRNQDGRVDVWNVDTGRGIDAANVISSTHYGSFAGWTATGMAVGSDNHTRLLWTNQDGRANVWNVDTGTGIDRATDLSPSTMAPIRDGRPPASAWEPTTTRACCGTT